MRIADLAAPLASLAAALVVTASVAHAQEAGGYVPPEFISTSPEHPDGDGGIALSGHSDVVPVAGQDWSTDPFQATEKDGRIYGRGACDMKGFIAASLALVPEMIEADLKTPLHLVYSYDEELGCIGIGTLIDEIAKSLPQPAMAIIGELTP